MARNGAGFARLRFDEIDPYGVSLPTGGPPTLNPVVSSD
jgi:hypothetical protein